MDFVVPFVTLTAMEIVLGIDNIVFIAILVGRLPAEQQARARSLGLVGAMVTRILLLLSITWVMGLTKPVFHLTDLGIPEAWVQHDGALEKARAGHGDINGVSWKDLILLGGGFFLIWHSVREIHDKVEGKVHSDGGAPSRASFGSVLVQIALFDIIFSLDSVITAVGMAQHIEVMIASVVAAMIVMLIFSGKISRFVDTHPTIKILALSFLILIGVLLLAEGFGTGMNKGYIYFAMAFSLIVESINMRVRPATSHSASDD
jgi:predicted tellurium resistance membrane protein TerC